MEWRTILQRIPIYQHLDSLHVHILSCVIYLFLHNESLKLVGVRQQPFHYLYFCGMGVQEELSWVVLAQDVNAVT